MFTGDGFSLISGFTKILCTPENPLLIQYISITVYLFTRDKTSRIWRYIALYDFPFLNLGPEFQKCKYCFSLNQSRSSGPSILWERPPSMTSKQYLCCPALPVKHLAAIIWYSHTGKLHLDNIDLCKENATTNKQLETDFSHTKCFTCLEPNCLDKIAEKKFHYSQKQ